MATPGSILHSGAASYARNVRVIGEAFASKATGLSCSSREQPPPALTAS